MFGHGTILEGPSLGFGETAAFPDFRPLRGVPFRRAGAEVGFWSETTELSHPVTR